MKQFTLTKNMAAVAEFRFDENPESLHLTLAVSDIKHGWATFHARTHYTLQDLGWVSSPAPATHCDGTRRYFAGDELHVTGWQLYNSGLAVPPELSATLLEDFNAWCAKHPAKWDKILKVSREMCHAQALLNVETAIGHRTHAINEVPKLRRELAALKKTHRRLSKTL